MAFSVNDFDYKGTTPPLKLLPYSAKDERLLALEFVARPDLYVFTFMMLSE